MLGNVLPYAPDDRYEEEILDLSKGRRAGTLLAGMVPDPNSGVQPLLGKCVLRNSPQDQRKKGKHSHNGNTKEEEGEER